MIVLLGGSGYVGQAFQRQLVESGNAITSLSRKQLDYTRYDVLVEFLRETRPHFLINAAGFTGRPNVDACELAKADTLQGNTLYPITVSHACQRAGIAWGHVSSGCIYSGAKISDGGTQRVETNLMTVELQKPLNSRSPIVQGFREDDLANFNFRSPPCSFYSGTKALAEEALAHDERVYIWRMRLPFDEQDDPRNYLSKLQRYSKIYENFNSLSHRGDFVRACLDLHSREAPFGTYNVTNPGYVSSRQVVEMIQRYVATERSFEYWLNDTEFYRTAAKTPRSNCILDVSKLLSTGVSMRPVEDALVESLENWQSEPQMTRPARPITNLGRKL